MGCHGAIFCDPGIPEQGKSGLAGEKMLRHVERAGAACAGALHDVEVDHGGGYVGMAEKVLDGADVDAAFEEVGCETVTERVAGGGFG